MAEFKGTKGKWDLTVDEYSNSISVDDGKGMGEICTINTDDKHLAESIWNAQLISKAPEMLEMLQEIVANWDFANDLKFHDPAMEKARKLIKEATEP